MRATKYSNLFSFILTNLTSLRASENFTTWEDLLKNPLIKPGVAENHRAWHCSAQHTGSPKAK